MFKTNKRKRNIDNPFQQAEKKTYAAGPLFAGGGDRKSLTSKPSKNVKLTEEQQACVDSRLPLTERQLLCINAYAGTGKTQTLEALIRARPKIHFLVLYFNDPMRKQALRRLSGLDNVGKDDIHTYHSLAYRTMIKDCGYRLISEVSEFEQTIRSNKVVSQAVAKIMGTTDGGKSSPSSPAASKIGRLEQSAPVEQRRLDLLWRNVFAALEQFCRSDRLRVSAEDVHNPKLKSSKKEEKKDKGKEKEEKEQNVELKKQKKVHAKNDCLVVGGDDDGDDDDSSGVHLLPSIEQVVATAQSVVDATIENDLMQVNFDMMLKLMHLCKQPLADDYNYQAVALDEAQDLMPVAMAIVLAQPWAVVACGDSRQQINQWTGAVNALDRLLPHFAVDNRQQLVLSETFRFSGNVAQMVNNLFGAARCPLSVPLKSCVSHKTAVLPSTRAQNDATAVNDDSDLQVLKQALRLGQTCAIIARTKSAIIGHVDRLSGFVTSLDQRGRIVRRYQQLESYSYSSSSATLPFSCCKSIAACIRQMQRLASLDDGGLSRRVRRAKTESDAESLKLLERLQLMTSECRAAYAKHLKQLSFRLSQQSGHKDTIALFTAHSAKGLEWDVVAVAQDFDKSFDDVTQQPKTMVNGDDEEDDSSNSNNDAVLFCLYVALTRARHKMLLPPALHTFYLRSA